MVPTLRVKRNPTYRSWWAMWRRCEDLTNEDYGGRGITVCERWEDFAAFVADMGPRPEGRTLDRIDGTQGYGPGNCRWATAGQQANNRSSSRLIEHEGRTHSVTEWARLYGLSDQTLFYRLRAGWDIERALTETSTRKRTRCPTPTL